MGSAGTDDDSSVTPSPSGATLHGISLSELHSPRLHTTVPSQSASDLLDDEDVPNAVAEQLGPLHLLSYNVPWKMSQLLRETRTLITLMVMCKSHWRGAGSAWNTSFDQEVILNGRMKRNLTLATPRNDRPGEELQDSF